MYKKEYGNVFDYSSKKEPDCFLVRRVNADTLKDEISDQRAADGKSHNSYEN